MRIYLKLVHQNLSLPVDLHNQGTDGLLYFIGNRLPVFLDVMESERKNCNVSNITLLQHEF